MAFLWLFITTIFCICQALEEKSATMCSGEDMTLTCPGREVIVVLNAEYSQTSCSQSQVEEECLLEDLMGFFSSHCFGKKTCTVTTQDVISALNKPCLGTGPLAVSSTCVNATSIWTMCQNENTQRLVTGFVRSPHYPDHYDQGHNCRLQISAAQGQQLRILILDLQLEEKQIGQLAFCYDQLVFLSQNWQKTYCQKTLTDLPNEDKMIFYNFTRDEHIYVNFESSTDDHYRGFLFKYEVLGCADRDIPRSPAHGSLQLRTLSEAVFVCDQDYMFELPAGNKVLCVDNAWQGVPSRCIPRSGSDIITSYMNITAVISTVTAMSPSEGSTTDIETTSFPTTHSTTTSSTAPSSSESTTTISSSPSTTSLPSSTTSALLLRSSTTSQPSTVYQSSTIIYQSSTTSRSSATSYEPSTTSYQPSRTSSLPPDTQPESTTPVSASANVTISSSTTSSSSSSTASSPPLSTSTKESFPMTTSYLSNLSSASSSPTKGNMSDTKPTFSAVFNVTTTILVVTVAPKESTSAIGIGIGVGTAAITIIVLCAFLVLMVCKKKRSKKTNSVEGLRPSAHACGSIPSMYAGSKSRHVIRYHDSDSSVDSAIRRSDSVASSGSDLGVVEHDDLYDSGTYLVAHEIAVGYRDSRNLYSNQNRTELTTIREEYDDDIESSIATDSTVSHRTAETSIGVTRPPNSRHLLRPCSLQDNRNKTKTDPKKTKVAYPLFKEDTTGNLENYLDSRRVSV